MSDRLTPTNVAKRLDVSVSTVRRLTGEYADWLSPTASPRPGGTRVYTEQDVEVLGVIVAMRQDGAPEDEIVRAIESGIIPSNVATMPPQPPTAPPTLPPLRIDATDLAAQIEPLTAAVRASNESMDRHAAAMERLATSLIWLVAALFIVVLLVVAVAVGWIG